MGKPIGNGHPMAVVVTTKEISDNLFAFSSTVGNVNFVVYFRLCMRKPTIWVSDQVRHKQNVARSLEFHK